MSEINTALASLKTEVTDFINKSNEEAASQAKLSKDTKAQMEGLESKLSDINAQLTELEQQGAARADAGKPAKSIGQQFTESDAYNAFRQGSTNKARFEIQNNTITGTDTTVAPERRGEVVGGAFRNLMIADALGRGTTTSNAVEYTRELLFTNNAAEVAENNAKPETTLTFELINQPIATIAHWIKLSKQVIDDAPRLASYVDGRMRYGVQQHLDDQLINGNGTGANIGGLLATGNHTAFTPGGGTKGLENIRLAKSQVEQADYMASAVFLNPADLAAIDLEAGSDGHYKSGDPRAHLPRPIWGLPVIASNAVPAGKFLVGAFDLACQFTERQGVIVDLSESDGDNFTNNLVTMRAECRGALEIWRPASVVAGNLTGA